MSNGLTFELPNIFLRNFQDQFWHCPVFRLLKSIQIKPENHTVYLNVRKLAVAGFGGVFIVFSRGSRMIGSYNTYCEKRTIIKRFECHKCAVACQRQYIVRCSYINLFISKSFKNNIYIN